MPYAITADSRVTVAIGCDFPGCANSDRYRNQPAWDMTRDAIADGWHCPDDDGPVFCPCCVENGNVHTPLTRQRNGTWAT